MKEGVGTNWGGGKEREKGKKVGHESWFSSANSEGGKKKGVNRFVGRGA